MAATLTVVRQATAMECRQAQSQTNAGFAGRGVVVGRIEFSIDFRIMPCDGISGIHPILLLHDRVPVLKLKLNTLHTKSSMKTYSGR